MTGVTEHGDEASSGWLLGLVEGRLRHTAMLRSFLALAECVL